MCGCTANHSKRTYHFCSREHELRDIERLESRIRADERNKVLEQAARGFDKVTEEIRAEEREQCATVVKDSMMCECAGTFCDRRRVLEQIRARGCGK